MVTSAEWWAEVKKSPERFHEWLAKQYHGEVTAAPRIRALAERPDATPRAARILGTIADQEEQHASWVAELLRARGIAPGLLAKKERYWDETLTDVEDTFTYLSAVAAHAEAMRLERIAVIAADPEAPADVRETFARILRDEEFHARAFAELAGERALEAARGHHERGLAALGLTV